MQLAQHNTEQMQPGEYANGYLHDAEANSSGVGWSQMALLKQFSTMQLRFLLVLRLQGISAVPDPACLAWVKSKLQLVSAKHVITSA